jgi:hypothetical protein
MLGTSLIILGVVEFVPCLFIFCILIGVIYAISFNRESKRIREEYERTLESHQDN